MVIFLFKDMRDILMERDGHSKQAKNKLFHPFVGCQNKPFQVKYLICKALQILEAKNIYE